VFYGIQYLSVYIIYLANKQKLEYDKLLDKIREEKLKKEQESKQPQMKTP
jgi:hypothetical protein